MMNGIDFNQILEIDSVGLTNPFFPSEIDIVVPNVDGKKVGIWMNLTLLSLRDFSLILKRRYV